MATSAKLCYNINIAAVNRKVRVLRLSETDDCKAFQDNDLIRFFTITFKLILFAHDNCFWNEKVVQNVKLNFDTPHHIHEINC